MPRSAQTCRCMLGFAGGSPSSCGREAQGRRQEALPLPPRLQAGSASWRLLCNPLLSSRQQETLEEDSPWKCRG